MEKVEDFLQKKLEVGLGQRAGLPVLRKVVLCEVRGRNLDMLRECSQNDSRMF